MHRAQARIRGHIAMRTRVSRFGRGLLLVSSAVVASAAAQAAPCMYGPDGSVIHRPAGAECRDVAGPDSLDESQFAPPRPSADGAWLDIRLGDEHIFEIEIKHGRSDYGEPFKYTNYKGTQHRAVIAGPERFGPGAMERRLTLRVAEGAASLDRTDLQRDFIKATPAGWELLSINRYWFFRRQDVDYGKGSLLLPARIAQGVKWNSARISDELIKIEETGEVIGVEDVTTPAGLLRNCLHVRYSGDIGTRHTRLDGRSTVMGRYARDVWFARGVGVVREQEQGRLETIQRGQQFAFTSQYQAVIKGVKQPSSLPAKQR